MMALDNEVGELPTPDRQDERITAPEVDDYVVHGDAKVLVASQWKLIWWRFRRHRVALFSAIVLLVIYTLVLFGEFFAPYDPGDYAARYTYAPPQALNLLDTNADGQARLQPPRERLQG